MIWRNIRRLNASSKEARDQPEKEKKASRALIK